MSVRFDVSLADVVVVFVATKKSPKRRSTVKRVWKGIKGVFKDHAAAANPWLSQGALSPQSSPQSIFPAAGGVLPPDESIAPNTDGELTVDGSLEASVDGADETVG